VPPHVPEPRSRRHPSRPAGFQSGPPGDSATAAILTAGHGRAGPALAARGVSPLPGGSGFETRMDSDALGCSWMAAWTRMTVRFRDRDLLPPPPLRCFHQNPLAGWLGRLPLGLDGARVRGGDEQLLPFRVGSDCCRGGRRAARFLWGVLGFFVGSVFLCRQALRFRGQRIRFEPRRSRLPKAQRCTSRPATCCSSRRSVRCASDSLPIRTKAHPSATKRGG
jgi:hypothetical protein